MKEYKNSEIFFTPRQAAKYLNLSLSTIKNYIYAGKLKTLMTPGGHHRIRKSELLATMGEARRAEGSYELLRRFAPQDEGSGSFPTLHLDTIVSIIFGICSTLGAFGNSLRLHSEKVASLSFDIGKKEGFVREDLENLKIGALLHDIGKLSIDTRILTRQGTLTEQEYEIVKTHPEKGIKMTEALEPLKGIREIIAQHHERWDGKGYPHRLLAEKISKVARIVSLSEAYDSMTSSYSYKTPISKDQAISEIKLNKNTQFDPEVVEAFLSII